MHYFSQYTDNKDNNFNLLRLLAALIVLYTHSYGLSGHYPHPDNAPIAYFIAIIGAYAAELDYVDYFQQPSVYQFILINLSLLKTELSLPGVFMHNIFANQVNGSLWTLPAEVRLYLYVAVLGVLGFFRQAWHLTLLAALVLVVYIYQPRLIPLISDNSLYYYPALLFLIGSLIYLYRQFIPANGWILSFLLVALVYCVYAISDYKVWIYTLCLPYLVFWLAYNLPCLHFVNRWGDYSYGLYIYAFPIQQFLISHHPQLSVDQFFFLSLLCTLLVAIPSWHLLEKPALKLKAWVR